jgi:hypothetical protein
VAFERDNYDDARVPESFSRTLSEEFACLGDDRLCIEGYGAAFDRMPEGCLEIAFSWDTYRDAMLNRDDYSVEYRMLSNGASCAVQRLTQ